MAASTLTYLENPLPEARALALDSSKARHHLGWLSPWNTERVVVETARWYQAYHADSSQARAISLDQIHALRSELRALQ